MSDFRIPPPADAILAQAAPALLQMLNREDIVIGGGTALAARWRHRRSTDIDLTIPASAFDGKQERMAELLTDRSIMNVRFGHGWLNGKCESGDFGIVTTAPLLPSGPDPADRESGFGLALETTAEILARKLRLRIYGSGTFVTRDFYDICTAGERDSEALDLALSVMSVEERGEISSEIASMGAKAVHLGRPLTDVHRPSWLKDLAERTAKLIAPPRQGT